MTRLSPSVLLALSVLTLGGCGHKPAAEAPEAEAKAAAPVQVTSVRRGAIERTLTVTGTLNPLLGQEVALSAPVAGVLDRLPVRYGQTVRQGQVVAHLGTQTLAGQIQQAQATISQNQLQVQQAQVGALQQRGQTRTAVAQALAAVAGAQASLKREQATLTGDEATLQNAQESLTRQQTLLAAGVVARKDVEAAQLAVNTAQAAVAAQRQTVDAQRQAVAGQQQAVAAARAAGLQDVVKQQDIQVARRQVQNARGALATAQAQYALYTLRAPLTGEVTNVGASVGQTVDPATKIVTLANLDTLQVQIAVPSAQARRVHPGQAVRFTVDAAPGRVFRTTVQTVGTQVDPASATVPVLAQIQNPGHRLRDNLLAQVQIVTDRRAQALLVPASAVLTDPDTHQASVVVVGPDSVAHVRPVTVGLTSGNTVEVTRGVGAGDRIAVAGQYALPDGAKVAAQPAAGREGSVSGAP